MLQQALKQMPLIAILRGLQPKDAVPVSDLLLDCGFTVLEVPLNSPGALDSIAAIRRHHGDRLVLGAGTVITPREVDDVREAGGELIISPNCNPEVIRQTKARGMVSIPGCYTPTDCFSALAAGADLLKIFPADTLGLPYLSALKSVLPAGTGLVPTGGVDSGNLADYLDAGIAGVGLGSALFRPDRPREALEAAARHFASIAALRQAGSHFH